MMGAGILFFFSGILLKLINKKTCKLVFLEINLLKSKRKIKDDET